MEYLVTRITTSIFVTIGVLFVLLLLIIYDPSCINSIINNTYFINIKSFFIPCILILFFTYKFMVMP